jgi:AraC-like DNA-binding protein
MAVSASRLRSNPVEEKLGESGIWAFESRHGEAFTMATTVHRFPKLLLIREGKGKVEGDWGDPSCKKGDCVLVPPGIRHRIVDQTGHAISLYGLGVASRLMGCVPEILSELPSGVYPISAMKSVAVEHRMRRVLYLNGKSDAASRLACVAAALELFAEVSMALRGTHTADNPQRDESIDAMLVSYLQWLDRHFFEPVTLNAAAAACGMSRRYFTTTFKTHVGMTWLAYVHQLRVNHALDLLKNTDRKITSIAFQSGFDDLTTFYRVFFKVTSKRPGDVRS